MTEDRTKNKIILKDFYKRRANLAEFTLCKTCPSPPNSNAMYKITCAKHNM